MQEVSVENIKWFQPNSRFSEKHFKEEHQNISIGYKGRKENHVVNFSQGKDLSFSCSESVYDSGVRRDLYFNNRNSNEVRRPCWAYQIIKTEYADKNKPIDKIVSTYVTDQSYGIEVVKEKNSAGKWFAKIYKKCNYSHPNDNPLYPPSYAKEKAFYADELLLDSTEKYSKDYIEEILTKYKLPKKASLVLKKLI